MQELCAGGRGKRKVVPLPSLRFEDAFLTCRAMGGFINLPISLQDIKKDLDVFSGNKSECWRTTFASPAVRRLTGVQMTFPAEVRKSTANGFISKTPMGFEDSSVAGALVYRSRDPGLSPEDAQHIFITTSLTVDRQ